MIEFEYIILALWGQELNEYINGANLIILISGQYSQKLSATFRNSQMSNQAQCVLETIYTPVFNGQGSIWPADIIIASIIFAIQLTLVIFCIVKGFDTAKSRNKQIIPKPISQQNNALSNNPDRSNYKINQHNQGNLERQDSKRIKNDEKQQQRNDRKDHVNISNQSFLQNQFMIEIIDDVVQQNKNQKNENLSFGDSIKLFFFRFPDSLIQKIEPTVGKNRICCILTIFLMTVSLTFLLISVLAAWQATVYTYGNGQCVLKQTVSSFISGNTSSWIGLSNIVPNVTQLDLDLKTRVSVSKNGIKGLLLNGTSAPNLKGIGFPIGTRITDVTTGSLITTTNAQTYINAYLRQWLVMNSSLSFTRPFPICQSFVTPITHPTVDGASIQLNYMSSICSSMRSEVQKIVSNGRAIDTLLTKLTNVQSTTAIIDANLSAYAAVYSQVATQGTQFQQQFSSLNIDFSLIKASTLGSLIIYGVYCFFVIFYLGWVCLRSNLQNSTPVSTCFGKFLLISGVVISVLISLASIYLSLGSEYAQQQCSLFNRAISDELAFNQTQIRNLSPLFDPIHKCTTARNSFFLMDNPSTNAQYRSKIEQLYILSSLYNQTTPTSLYQSESAAQSELVKGYILHLQTIPVFSSSASLNVNITQAIRQLQLYSNGNSPDSQQLRQCGKIVTQDTFVFNAYDCKAPLINMSISNTSEISATEPRCFQIPTYEKQSGSASTSLNNAQNNIPLAGSCATVQKIFNISETGCFMNRRIALFTAAGCSQVGTQYGKRLLKLLKFAIEASQYTDVYLQNLRNFFGIQAVLSSNITEFFNGQNMSAMMLDFGQLSNNLLNKTECSYIKAQTEKVHQNFCPSSNSVASLFEQGAWWSLMMILLTPFSVVSFYVLDISIRSSSPIQNQAIPKNQEQAVAREIDADKSKLNLTQQALSSHKKIKQQRNFNVYEIDQPQATINNQIQQQINVFALIKQKEESDLGSKYSGQTINLTNHQNLQLKDNQQTIKKQQNIFDSAKQEETIQIQELNTVQDEDRNVKKGNFNIKINKKIPPIFFKSLKNESNSEKSQVASSLQDIHLQLAEKKKMRYESMQKVNKSKVEDKIKYQASQFDKNALKSIKKNKNQYQTAQFIKQILQRNFQRQNP